MGLGILLLFIAVPLIELALLIKLGSWIGILPTVGLVIVTAVVGTFVLRRQGLQTMMRLNEMMARGEPPIGPVAEGAVLLLAGAFLLTPGILTDTVGFLLLIPPIRRAVVAWGLTRLVRSGSIRVTTFGRQSGGSGPRRPASDEPHAPGPDRHGRPGRHNPHDRPGPVIDGEYERLDERDRKPDSEPPNKS